MYLSKRLLMIASLVPKDHKIVDVGTDHAYLPIYLVEKGICPRAIATEVRLGPFHIANRNIKMAGLKEKIDVRLGFGLEPISMGEVNTAIIAGMGSESIIDIIKKSKDKVSSLDLLILQPMTKIPVLRKQLFDMGFEILDEKVVKEEQRFYEILIVKMQGEKRHYDDIDLYVGPIIRQMKNSVNIDYIKTKKEKLENLLLKIRLIKTDGSRRALKKYEKQLEMLEEVLQ
ncbi:MAG TPA: SAM-dependent methyltransferase [Thermoanaerobacterales bacterium]|nr:SAM-dependent methyltransferase [Thermoanaerobacterales bacterium]